MTEICIVLLSIIVFDDFLDSFILYFFNKLNLINIKILSVRLNHSSLMSKSTSGDADYEVHLINQFKK